MAVYNLSPIYRPQYAANASAKLVMATGAVSNIVPAGYNYVIKAIRAVNVTAAPVTLKLWRVPSGGAVGNDNLIVPVTVQVPVATNTFPDFDITVLWDAVLTPGEAIYAEAGSASAISVSADGAVVQL